MNILLVAMSENVTIRGVERYSVELVKSLLNHPDINTITVICGRWQSYFKDIKNDKLKFRYVRIPNKKSVRHLFHFFALPFYYRGYDIVHILNTNPILFKFGANVVVTIHDLAEYYVPEKYGLLQGLYRKFVSLLAAKCSDHIITDSQYSKDTIVNRLAVKSSKVDSVYLGIEHFYHANELISTHPSERPYLLYWSVIEKSKGVIEAVKAFVHFKEKYAHIVDTKQYKLLICGKKGNAQAELDNLLFPDVEVLGFVPDEQLKMIVSNAEAIIFPSLYEGFGFPALEAFALNDNVIASRTTSVGEISKEFAWLVEPTSETEIADAIYSAIVTPKKFTFCERNSCLARFSWVRCADETIKVYKRVLSS